MEVFRDRWQLEAQDFFRLMQMNVLTNCAERERQLRKKPIPTRFRDDKYWELYVNKFPDDTTEVVIHCQFFLWPRYCIVTRVSVFILYICYNNTILLLNIHFL